MNETDLGMVDRLRLHAEVAGEVGLTSVVGILNEAADRVEALERENHALILSLKEAMDDMAALDSCVICHYWERDRCCAPGEQRAGGSCFVWRGRGS